MSGILSPDYRDGLITNSIKRELTLMIANYKDSEKYTDKDRENLKEILPTLVQIAEVLDANPRSKDSDKLLLFTFKTFIEYGVLAPLTFNPEDFTEFKGFIANIRYPYIIKDDNEDKYKNLMAYSISTFRVYSHYLKEEIPNPNFETIKGNKRVYLTKGGNVTGEYIDTCYISKHKVENNRFTVNNAVNLNVDIIIGEDLKPIYVVDSRNTKLHALTKFYEVPIKFDKNVTRKYDIRKYKKLDNEKDHK